MRDLTEFINAGEIGRDNLPIEDKPKSRELQDFKSVRPINQATFDQFPDRLKTGTKDLSFFPNEDRENKIALSQSNSELWGKGIWNTAVEATVGTLEGAAMLPGIDWTLRKIGGSDTGYGNFISEAMNDVKQGMKTDVYETLDSREGFAPWDGSWWAKNSETLGTTLSLMIPAMGTTALIGKLGKLSKAAAMRNSAKLTNTIANNANLVNKVENASKVLGQATISRWTENTMEAQGTFDDTYNTLLAQGLSQEAAKEQAGVAASRAWNANWVNLAQDVVQFGTIGKTVGKFSSRSMKTLAENAKSKPRQVAGFLGGMGSESLEEAGQYMIGEESKRSVTDNEYKFSDVFNRVIDDYAKDPQLHTSMFFGALGGGVFQGIGDVIQNRVDKRIQKDIEDNKQKVNAILNDDYVKDANIDISLVFNKAMAYADMGVIDDLKDSINKELTKSEEEHIADGKTKEEIEEYKSKLNDVIADIDFISDVRSKADNGYKSPMAVRLQVASEYTLRTYGKKLNGVKSDYAKLSSDSLSADGTIETLNRLKDIDTLDSLKIFRTQISVPKADGSTPVRNLEEVTSFIDERIKTIEKEIQDKLPEGTTMESYLKRDKNTAIANQDAFRNNIAAQEEFVIAMEDARLELEIAKGDKVDILTKRAKQTQLNQLKDKINKGELTLAEMNKAVAEINDPSFITFLNEKLKSEELSAVPTGKDRVNNISKRYKGNNLLLAKELKELDALEASVFDIDSEESFVKKYSSDNNFKNIVDKYYDNKAKTQGTFYDTTELRYENDTRQENTSADINTVTNSITSGDRLMNSLHVALVKKIDENNVIFYGIEGSPQMSIQEFEKIYSKQYLWTEFTPLYRLDGSIVYNDFNTFTDSNGNVVTIVDAEAQSILNDPSIDLRGKNTRYKVYPNHPIYNPTNSLEAFIVGVEVEVSKDRWLVMGRMAIGKPDSKISKIREVILSKYKESGSEVIDLGNIVTGKRNGFIVRKPKVNGKDNKNPVSSIAKKDDVLAVIVPLENSSIDLVYGKLSDAKIVEMRNTVASTKLAQYAGNVVLMKKQADGTYTPTKLNTKKLKEVDLGNGKTLYNNVETLLENFEKLGGNHTQEQLDKLHTDLHKLTFLVLNRNADGKYQFVISTQVREQWSEPVTFEELKSYVKENKAVRIDKTRINDARYHKSFIDKYNILTTDIVPENQLVGASIAIDIDKEIPLTKKETANNKEKEKAPAPQKLAEDSLEAFSDDVEFIELATASTMSLEDLDSPIDLDLIFGPTSTEQAVPVVVDTKADIERIKETPEGKEIENRRRLTTVSDEAADEDNYDGYSENSMSPVGSDEWVKTGEWYGTYINKNGEKEQILVNSEKELLDVLNAKYDAELAALEKPKVNNIPTEEDDFDDAPKIKRNRVKEDVEDLTPLTETEKQWFAKTYPNTDIQVFEDLSTIQKKGGPEAFGMFSNGLIYLTSDAPIGTIYHEAFHMVLHTMLTDKELKELLAQQRYARANKLKKNATDEEVEESLTYEFQDMMLTNGEIVNTFTGKIKDFFKRLWNLIGIILERGGLKKGPSIKTMFYRVNRGLYSSFPKYKRNVTRFRKGVYGDLSVTEAKMASNVIANIISNIIIGTGEGKNLRTRYNMPDAETVDILKKANKLANPNYVRKENEIGLTGYTFNDLIYEAYKKLNKRRQESDITENEKNSIIRVMNALLYIDENGNKQVKNLKNLVVGEMSNFGIKIDVSNLNETVSNYISEDEDGVPDNQTDESFDYKDRFTSSLKDFRARSRQLFASIPNSNKSFATFELFHDSSTVYNTIKKALEGSLDFQDMLNKLDNLYGNHPDYEILQERFISDPTLLTEFYNNFAQRMNTPFIKVITNSDGTKTVLESNKANVTSDIRADWFENFLNETNYIDPDTGQISDLGKEKATVNLELLNKIVEDNKKNLKLNPKDAYAVVSLIAETGILMDIDTIYKILTTESLDNKYYNGRYKADNILIGNQFGKGLDYFYKLIIDGINPFQVSDSDTGEKGSSVTINKMLDNVSYQMSTMFPELRSTIFQNGKNKSVDSNLLPRDSARRLQRFKDSSENHNGFLLDQMKADPFWKDSEFLEQFHIHAKEVKLAILDTSEVDKGDNREYSEFTSKNFHTTMMNLFFNYSKNRKAEVEGETVDVPGKENLKYGWYGMPIPSNSTAYNLIRFAKYDTETAIEHIIDAVRNEKNRIEELEKLISANQDLYDAWVALGKRTRKIIKPEVFKDIPFNMLLNGRKYHVFSELNDGDKAIVFSDDNAFEVAVKNAYKNYNDKVFQEYVNKDIIEIGNNGYVIKDENLDKRTSYSKREANTSNEVYQRNKSSALKRNLDRYNANATLMNIQMAFFFAGDIANYGFDKNTNSASIEDFFKRVKQINSPGTYLDINAKFKTDKGKELSVRKKYKVAIVQDQDLVVSQQLNEIIDIEVRYVTALGYSESEIEKHVNFINSKYSEMNITDAFTMIDIFRYREIAIGATKWSNAKEVLYQKVLNNEYISPNEMEILQPFKPFRYSIEIVDGKQIPTQHKNAEMLIIPQMAKYNSVHKTALEKMGYKFNPDFSFTFDENGRQDNKYIDALMYNSSVKVGELYTFATEESINPDETQLFNNDDYRIQMGTPEHFYDSEINFGSQLRKLIIEGFDINDFTKYNINGEQLTAKQIIDSYNEILTANLAESYQDVRSIFTNDNGEIDTTKMVKELKKYIIERELGNDYLEAVELIDGKPTIPYWYPTISYNLQAIFSAFYKNNITKQTAAGMALFNSSSVGYNTDGIIRKPKIKFNVNANGERYIEHIEALIPMNSKHLLKFVDKTTGLIDVAKVERFDPKLLKSLFYRIPSEDKYSLVHIKVIGFIPNIMGAQIILPDEITTIAGLDFDIDKMFGMAYEIDNKTGKTIPSGMDSKGARNNKLLDIMYGIMQLPQTAGRQLSPGNFENLTQVKKDVLELTKADTSLNFASLISKAEVQQRNMTGNELIGTFANHRVNHVIFTLADFNFVESIDFDGYSLYSLSETNSPIDKKDIGLRLATFVAAVVDNAKDPIAAMINLAPFLSDVAGSMIRVGYSEDLVGIFLSQKVFVKLTQEYSNSSDYGKSNVIKILRSLQNDLIISTEQKDQAKKITISTELLKENIQNPNPIVDYALINQMIKLVNQADMLRKVMSTMRFDSTAKAAGPTYFETEAKILEYESVIGNDKIITGYEEFMDNDSLQWVRDFYQLGVLKAQQEMLSIMELPYNKSVFSDAREYFSRWKLDGSLRPNELETIARAVMTVNASSFEPFNNNRSLNVVTNFPDTFQKVKNKSIRYSALTGLITVEQANPSNTRYSVPFKTLKFNKLGVSPSHMQTIREVWSEMMESDDVKVRDFAQDLAAYSFFTSGFLFKKNSIAEGIPISWMTQITHNGKTFLQHMKEKNESSALSQIQKEEIVRNLYQSLDIFATVKEKDNGIEVVKNVDSIYTVDVDMNVEANKFYKDDVINKDVVRTYSPYIRLSLNNDIRLLKLDSFNRKENTAIYKEIQPLGIHNRYVQFSDGSEVIKGVISIGTSTKRQEIINRINSFDTIESLVEAWNSPKFSEKQRELYKSDFTNRKLQLSTPAQPSTSVTREFTPENITTLKPNEVFVFGANTAGGHGGGTAGLAQRGTTSSNYTALPIGTKGKWAEYGVVDKLMQGTEGKSFGIVTKTATISGTSLKIGTKRSVPLSRIEESITALIKTANENPNLKFLVTKFGTNMAGFSEQEMKSLLENKTLPDNIILPKEFEVRTTVQPSTQEQSIVETQSVVKEEIPNDISNMIKEENKPTSQSMEINNTTYESIQYAIGMYLADKNDTSKTTITEDVNSFEEYSKNPINISKESWEKMTREEQLANWYAEQKCR
jgi:hypothetical protein